MENQEFELLYHQYVNRVFKYLLKLSGDYHVAEELTQETFYKAFIHIDLFRGNSSLYVWLCQIGKHLYYNLLRSDKKNYNFDEMESLKSDFDLEKTIIAAEQARQITKIVYLLPEPYQTVFFFRTYLELTYKEVGSHFKKSDNWARVTYYRSKKMIQEKLKECGEHEM